jgi:hypothetical protein
MTFVLPFCQNRDEKILIISVMLSRITGCVNPLKIFCERKVVMSLLSKIEMSPPGYNGGRERDRKWT